MSSIAEAVTPLRRSPGTSVELAQALLGLLTSGAYQPGQRLPGERQMSQQMAVGRMNMREALKSLAVLGIVEVRQGDGTYLRGTTSELLPRMVEWGVSLGDHSVASLAEARHHVEVALAGLAAERRTPEDLDALGAALEHMRAAEREEDTAGFIEADIAFHLALADAAKNDVLAGVLRNVRVLLRVWTERLLTGPVSLTSSLALHVPVHEAVAAGDPVAGRAAMEQHMVQAVENLQRVQAADAEDDAADGAAGGRGTG